MALSDFFPYGAPELLDGASARMARSTMTASLLVAVIVVSLGAILARQVTSLAPTSIFEPRDLMPEIREMAENYQEHRVPPTEIAKDPHSLPRIVEDDLQRDITPERPLVPDGPVGVDPGPIEDVRAREGAGPLPTLRDPEPGEFVPVDEYPTPVRCSDVAYPDLARSAGVEGMVRVLMLVGLRGKVERAIIAPKGSVPMLDQAALDAALTCVFTPALASGHPVKVWVSQNFRFSLHSAR